MPACLPACLPRTTHAVPHSTATAATGIVLTEVQLLGVLVALLAAAGGLLNAGSARLTAYVTTLGTMWHLVALAAFCLTLAFVAKTWQSAEVGRGGAPVPGIVTVEHARACMHACMHARMLIR